MNFDVSRPEGRVSIAIAVISIASLICWIAAIRRSGGGVSEALRRLAPANRRTGAFWTPLDAVVLMFVTLFTVQIFSGVLFAIGAVDLPKASFEFDIQMDPLASVVCVVAAQWIAIIGCTVLLSRRGPAITSIGWRYRGGDFALGLLWSLLLIPPTLWINFLVSQFVTYEHEVLDTLQKETDVAAVILLFLATAVVTPIAEEFLFRGLLQRSLSRIANLAVLRRQWREKGDSDERSKLLAEQSRYRWTDDATTPIWPIVTSSAVFALLHLGQGAAPIPLFFFAMGLGWLYRRTGRLWPSIIVHMVLNALTLAVTIAAPQVG